MKYLKKTLSMDDSSQYESIDYFISEFNRFLQEKSRTETQRGSKGKRGAPNELEKSKKA